MKIDPFTIKKYAKWHPIRLTFTAKARLIEQEAKWNFEKYALPIEVKQDLPPVTDADWSNTAVTATQLQHLLYALSITEHLTNTVAVEVGCYRGVTTKYLAQATSHQIIAVDPFIGYGGSELDYQYFTQNTAGLSNVTHVQKTSGEAARTWAYPPASFVFIDALHDYVNTSFDIEAWLRVMPKGGIVAMHDTDQICFAGTRKAVFDVYKNIGLELFAHVDNLTLLRK